MTGTGGKLPYFDSTTASLDKDFLAAITKPGLKPGDILAPIKSAFGWHVIQVMYRPTDDDWLKGLKTKADGGADFAALARDNSEADDRRPRRRPRLGRQGPAPRRALDRHLRHAGRQDQRRRHRPRRRRVPVQGPERGDRTPEGQQLEEIKASAFSNWYTAKKSAALIERDGTLSGTAG